MKGIERIHIHVAMCRMHASVLPSWLQDLASGHHRRDTNDAVNRMLLFSVQPQVQLRAQNWAGAGLAVKHTYVKVPSDA